MRSLVVLVVLTLLTFHLAHYTHSADYEVTEEPDVCQNGGSVLDGEHRKCSCPFGYKGYDCNQKVGICEGNPCRNSGECIDTGNATFYCQCSEIYSGVMCEKRVRPCDSQPCKNGANCTDDGIKCFKCECLDGFKGSDCSEKILPCEISPCKHGGICFNEENGDFKCACRNGYGGKMCERKDALYSSYVLDGKPEYIEQLIQWLGDDTDWRLCYRASQNGWRTKDFHSRCDHKGPTVIIIRVGYYIFGGYSDIAWGGSTGYKTSTKSFLFSLRNKDNLKPFTAAVYRNSQNAIYTNPGYGATFGGGHDLYIRDNAHISSGSYSNFGHTYKPPSGYGYSSTKAKSILAGAYNFLPTEIEVFYLG